MILLDLGKPYPLDDVFKAAARKHQSHYRATELNVGYSDKYGTKLNEDDAKKLLNYYDSLNVREELQNRFQKGDEYSFSLKRDGDLLRSEHIPFNLFAPLCADTKLAQNLIKNVFGLDCAKNLSIKFEYAPKPKGKYLDDATAFDAFFKFDDNNGKRIGIGAEVKYTEKSYPIGKKEKKYVHDPKSCYWKVSCKSGAFLEPSYSPSSALITDELRQIWRNHLLGLAMCQQNELDDFYSITLHPAGNHHFQRVKPNQGVIPEYQAQLTDSYRSKVFGRTYEEYIAAIDGDSEILKWKQYLHDRYIVKNTDDQPQ
uniref:PD-(D/E)XK nuclease-like domain-containing protein n=1 Tax=Chlorobium chlorochromatii (strain CaD3) TaxID=340177 RepID=Q3AT25_CHLCH